MQNATNEGFGIPDRYQYNPATQSVDHYKVASTPAAASGQQAAANPGPGFLQPVNKNDESLQGPSGYETRARLITRPADKTIGSFALPVFSNGLPQVDSATGAVSEGQRIPITFPTAKDRDEANSKLENLRKIGVPIAGMAEILRQSGGQSINPELHGRFDELVAQYNSLAAQEATGTSRVSSGGADNPLSLTIFNPIKADYTAGQIHSIVNNFAQGYRAIIRGSDGHYDYNSKTFFH